MIQTPNVTDASSTLDPLDDDLDRQSSSRPSKTKLKNSLERFRKFTVELVELPQGRFNQLEFPEDIKEALVAARRLTSLGARRRQMSFVSRLVQDLDIEAIRETIRNLDHGRPSKPTTDTPCETRAMTGVEVMADKLLGGDDQAVFALTSGFAPSERQMLRTYLRKTKKTLQAGGNRNVLRKDLANYLSSLRSAEEQGNS